MIILNIDIKDEEQQKYNSVKEPVYQYRNYQKKQRLTMQQ